MRRTASFVVLVLLMGIVAVACGGGGVVDITPEELVEGIQTGVNMQETCRFEVNLEGNMEGIVEGEHGEIDMTMDCSGVIDVVDQKMQAETTTTIDLRVEGQRQTMTMWQRMYFLGDMGYLERPEEWIKGDVSQELWESQELLSQQIELLRYCEVRLSKTEGVTGIPCYVAEITPDADALFELISSLFPAATDMGLTRDSITSYCAKGWYAKDTFFPMRVRQEYDVTVKIGSDMVSGSCATDIVFYDYNQPVLIQLPAEAENAPYVGSLGAYLQ